MTTPAVPDTRDTPPLLAGDRQSLESWLEFCRETLPIKIGGLTPEQLCRRAVPPSNLSLLGVVRHLTKVERFWASNVVAGVELPRLYCEEKPDGDFDDTATDTALADVARHAAEVGAAREQAARVTDLDVPVTGRWRGQELNLRWIYMHLIEEYARHLGHVDLIRERVDGVTGY